MPIFIDFGLYFWCAVRVILKVALFSLLSSLFCLFYCFLVSFIYPCLFCSPVLLLFILCRGSFYSLLFVFVTRPPFSFFYFYFLSCFYWCLFAVRPQFSVFLFLVAVYCLVVILFWAFLLLFVGYRV